MDSQIAAIIKARKHGVGNRADSDLNRRTVVDILSDMASDLLLERPDRLRPDLRWRARRADDNVDTGRVDSRFAKRPWQLIVDFSDYYTRPLHRRRHEIIRGAETVFAALVRRA